VDEHEIALTEGGQAGANRGLAAFAAGEQRDRLARRNALDLPFGILEAARGTDNYDPIHLVEGQEKLEHARQRRAPVQTDECLAATTQA
jgi:hypothetical protein